MAVADDSTAPPKSSHVSDPALAPFLESSFDPAEQLNACLPALSLTGRPVKGSSASLADLSAHTQDVLSQLNAHTTRLSAILTHLTDDIVRSGGRLAYEVEVLRGETIGLTDVLQDGLKQDMAKLVPAGLALGTDEAQANRDAAEATPDTHTKDPDAAEATQHTTTDTAEPTQHTTTDTSPEYMTALRTLTIVRSRLEHVIKVFGEAMHWTIPPSDLSLASSLITVSAPEPDTDTAASLEQRGKDFASTLRSEIADLITGDPDQGPARANARIQALRNLARLWKGTAEEKARAKFVDALVKLAEDTQRETERERERSRPRPGPSASIATPQQQPVKEQGRGGFLENLSRIRAFVD